MTYRYKHALFLLIFALPVVGTHAQHQPLSDQNNVPVLNRWTSYEHVPPMPHTLVRTQPVVIKTADAHRPTEVLGQFWNGADWTDVFRIKARYDGDLLVEELMENNIPGVGWINGERTTTTHNVAGWPIEEVVELWNPLVGWANTSRTRTMYHANGDPTERIFETWNGVAWEVERRNLSTFLNGMITSMLTQMWNGAAWVDEERDTFTYPGALVVTVTEEWNGAVWENKHKSTLFNIHFDRFSGLVWPIVEFLGQTWDGAGWVNEQRSVITLNADGLPQALLFQTWTGAQWGSEYKETYTYNADDNLVRAVGERWDGAAWVLEVRRLIEWSQVSTSVEVETTPLTFQLYANYPNPFNASTRIRFVLPEVNPVRLVVYDVMGREVARLLDQPMPPGTHTVTWDAAALPSGLYLYRLTTGAFVQTRAMTLLK